MILLIIVCVHEYVFVDVLLKRWWMKILADKEGESLHDGLPGSQARQDSG